MEDQQRIKNWLVANRAKYRFDLSSGKSYHLHTTRLFTPGLWLKCELNHRSLPAPGDFACRLLRSLYSPSSATGYIQGLAVFSFPTTTYIDIDKKLENQKDNAWRALLLLRRWQRERERRARGRREQKFTGFPAACFKILKCVISWCLRYCIVMDPTPVLPSDRVLLAFARTPPSTSLLV